ncbi:MAG: SPOR domain-containing protein [Gammaproteobacteria bacterium]|nr:SPOR domain-containing protein [Gammaproteobacteria bacterium]
MSQSQNSALFVSNTLRQQLELIPHLLRFGHELLLITAKEGSGKTLLLQQLQRRLESDGQSLLLQGAEQPSIIAIFRQLAAAAGFSYSGRDGHYLIEQFRDHLQELGAPQLLLVDDAGLLPADSLEALIHFASLRNAADEPLLRLLLCGDDAFVPRLKSNPYSRELPLRHIELPPFSESELTGFVAWLHEQQLIPPSEMDEAALKQLRYRSEGHPATVISLLRQAGAAGAHGALWPWQQLRGDWRFWLTLSLPIVLILYFVVDIALGDKRLNSVKKTTVAAPTLAAEGEVLALPALPNPLVPRVADPQSSAISEEVPVAVIEESLPLALPPAVVVPPLPEPQAEPKLPNLIESPVTSDKGVTAAKAAEVNPMSNKERPVAVEAVKPTEKVAKIAAQPEPRPPRTEPVANWLSRAAEGSYALQLLAVSQRPDLLELRQRYQLQGALALYSRARSGEGLFVVVMGAYADKAAAQAVEAKLLNRELAPWVRDMATIREQVAAGKLMATLEAATPSKEAGKAAALQPSAAPAAPPASPPSSAKIAAENSVNANAIPWVWSQNSQHYTLQLAQAATVAEFASLIGQNGVAGSARLIPVKREGRRWYLLILGSFSDRAAAEQGKRQLQGVKAAVQIKSFATIQDELGRSTR